MLAAGYGLGQDKRCRTRLEVTLGAARNLNPFLRTWLQSTQERSGMLSVQTGPGEDLASCLC
jgi:hypothetical protein